MAVSFKGAHVPPEVMRMGIRWYLAGSVAISVGGQFVVGSPSTSHDDSRGSKTMTVSFKGAHVPPDVILMGIRWYLADPLSTRQVEALMEERGVNVNHSTLNRWVIKYSPQLEEACHRRKRRVWTSWRLDETDIKMKGEWKYLYRAVDKFGKTIDFRLTEQRDEKAARQFLNQAIGRYGGAPEKMTIDGSAANEAAIKSYHNEHGTSIEIRKTQYLNNMVEQDHRGIKRLTRPMLGFKSFEAAQATLTGIERVRMLRQGQLDGEEMKGLTVAEPFNKLAASSPH